MTESTTQARVTSAVHEKAALRLLHALINQDEAQIIIPAYEQKMGFWFGGGNMVQDADGNLWICGRYRNYGDSRTGLEAGTRGLECVLFRLTDDAATFERVLSFSKADLSVKGAEVLSIEGTALHRQSDATWELFVSSEKARQYPAELEHLQKSGTGVWSIDRMVAPTLDAFSPESLELVIENHDAPGYLHVKDPVVFDDDGTTVLMFCSHPVSWASSNTGYAVRRPNESQFTLETWQLVERGPIWDVAVTRVTDRFVLPSLGVFADVPQVAVYLYDGAESMRQLDQNPRGYQRPRGYSCEEIGGAMIGEVSAFPSMRRLSLLSSLFTSPHGTGSSRYVSTLVTDDTLYATWQQSQPDGSQPLVMNRLSMDRVEELLSE